MTDTQLRELYAQLLTSGERDDRDRCVSPERMLALVERRASEAERLGTLDHVMSCERCRREFELLRAIGHTDAQLQRQRRIPGLALAASLIIAVAGSMLGARLLMDRGAPEVMRGESASGITISPRGDITAGAPLTLRWHAVPGATGYTAEVLTPDGITVTSRSTTDTTLPLPPAAHLQPGASYRWWVRARLPDGTEQRSELRSFQIRR